MTWFLIAPIAPIMFAVSNYIDKGLINRYFKSGSVGALVIYSALIGVLLMPIFFVIIIGIILTKFWPKLVKENIERKLIVQKVVAISIMLVGGFLLTK